MALVKSKEAGAAAALRKLGAGFIKRLMAARLTIREMKKIARKHGRCIKECEIPQIADYLDDVEKNLDWYLGNLHETQEGRKA